MQLIPDIDGIAKTLQPNPLQFLTSLKILDLLLQFHFVFDPLAGLSFSLHFLSLPLHSDEPLHEKDFVQGKGFGYFSRFYLYQGGSFFNYLLQLRNLRHPPLGYEHVLFKCGFCCLLLLEQGVKHFALNEQLLHLSDGGLQNLDTVFLDKLIFKLVNIAGGEGEKRSNLILHVQRNNNYIIALVQQTAQAFSCFNCDVLYWLYYIINCWNLNFSMSLKQHNDIVEKLLAQIDSKDAEIENLKKSLHKAGALCNDRAKAKLDDNEKQTTKRITQLQKQYKDKINILNQQIRTRSLENKELKERLNNLKNIQAKQKQHIAEVLKKTAQLSSYDSKFAALVSHYQSQIQRKDKYISNLQKQLKQSFHESNLKQIQKVPLMGKEDSGEETNSNFLVPHNKSKDSAEQLTKCQEQISWLRKDLSKFKRLLEEKQKQFKDLSRRYADLTKQYYQMLNQYGGKQTLPYKNDRSGDRPMQDGRLMPAKCPKLRWSQERDLRQDASLAYSLATSQNKSLQGAVENSLTGDQIQTEATRSLMDQIIQILQVPNRVEVIPALVKIKSKCERLIDYELISKHAQSMLKKFGMGEVRISDVINGIELLEKKITKLAESSDLLDQICIQIGAKKQKTLQKIKDLKATQQQLFKNVKNVNFMQKLAKANKIAEFIEYFELDRQGCQLPEQLRRMYEQIKYVDKFIKQAQLILSKQPSTLEKSLQSILRYLQRKEAEETLKNGKEKVGRKNE